MNANDARITRVYAQETGGGIAAIENPAPNATQPGKASQFDVVIELDAGGIVAGGSGTYTVQLITVDVTNDCTVIPTAPFTQNISGSFSTAAPWVAVGTGGNPDYELLTVITLPVAGIPISAPFLSLPHILKFYAALISAGNQLVSVVESEPFVIV